MLNNRISLILILILTGCGNTEPTKVFTPYKIEGLIVPGHLKDAKETGFTNCEVSYYSYSCLGENSKEVFGIRPLKISINLNGDDNFQQGYVTSLPGDVRDLSPEKLSYRQIDLELSPDVYDEKCLAKNADNKIKPISCIKEKGTQVFIDNLREAGWIETEWKSYITFFRENVPVEISIQPYRNQVTIRPESLDTIKERLEAVAKRKNDEQRKKTQAEAVLQQLKQTN